MSTTEAAEPGGGALAMTPLREAADGHGVSASMCRESLGTGELTSDLRDARPLCVDGCGRPANTRGMAGPCLRRWYRAGRPASGPPPPMTAADRTARSNAQRLRAAPEEPVLLDAYDITWGPRRRPLEAVQPELRAARVKHQAADLIRCVAASDAEGVARLLGKVEDWVALSVVLAECADPLRTAVVAGQLTQRRERDRDAA